jgi:hypothetical protein
MKRIVEDWKKLSKAQKQELAGKAISLLFVIGITIGLLYILVN